MTGALLVLLLAQDPFQNEIDDAVRRFEAAIEAEQALTLLSSQLVALGARATNPIARRLAQDLRDGMASAAAPAFIDALVGRPDALEPLQAAFQDATTTAAGRIEIAEALLQLDDAMSWRAGLIGIASDERAALADRLRASKVLLEAEDPKIPDLLRRLVGSLPRRSEEDRKQVAAFLRTANTPLTRELLADLALPEREVEEPRVRILDDRPRAFTEPPLRPLEKKSETRRETFITMPSILAGGVTLLLLGLLLAEILRKG
jgi:hypothetical protein